MAEFKGTPGEWTLGGASNNQILDDKKAIIATAWCIKIGNQQQEANAKLIVAAPELLEALQKILSNFKSCIDGGNGELDTDKIDIEKAELAIKKATE